MGLITKTYTFSTGATILAAEHNTNYDTLFNWANGNVDNANVKTAANISLSKLSLGDDATFTGDLSFTNAATTTDILTITGNSLTTGGGLVVTSNSTSTSIRNLVQIVNDNAAANAATCLQIQQDGDAAHINLTGDTSNTTPIDGDVWYDGTNFKGYDGANTFIFGGAGQQIQVVNVMDGAVATGTTLMVLDDSIPTYAEGDEYMTLAITPTSATNALLIQVVWNGSTAGNGQTIMALYQDGTGTDAAIAATWNTSDGGTAPNQLVLTHYMIAGTASATTFNVRVGNSAAGTTTFNGSASGRYFGGVMASSITITEIAV